MEHQCWACYQTGGPYQRRAQCGVCFTDWGADLSLAPLLSPTTLLTARDIGDSMAGTSAPQPDDARSGAERVALRGDGERDSTRSSPPYGALGVTPGRARAADGGGELSWSGDSAANARMHRKPASRTRAAGAFAALFVLGLLVASRADLGSTTRVVTSVGEGGGANDGGPPTADADATAAAATVAQVVEGFEPPEVVMLSPPAVAAVVADAIADAAADAGAAAGTTATGEKSSARGVRRSEDEDAASEPDVPSAAGSSSEDVLGPVGEATLTADKGGCDADKTSSHGQRPCETDGAAPGATTSGRVITLEDRMRLILEEKGLIDRGAILPFEQARFETAGRSQPVRARVRRR